MTAKPGPDQIRVCVLSHHAHAANGAAHFYAEGERMRLGEIEALNASFLVEDGAPSSVIRARKAALMPA